jgi:hypothetical protein
MGTFTDNLLKLTEFPFSYSFIGLLALIFGQGLNFGEEDFLARLAPLLILMGFVATTLSITDPIGALQKGLLKIELERRKALPIEEDESSTSSDRHESILRMYYLGALLVLRIFYTSFIYYQTSAALTASMNRSWPRRYIIEKWQGEPRFEFEVSLPLGVLKTIRFKLTRRNGFPIKYRERTHGFLRKLDRNDLSGLYYFLIYLRDSTLRTTWIRREIDKITSMFYFAIVIITFISALILIPSFEDKLLSPIQGGNQTQDSSITTTVDDMNSTTTITMTKNAVSPTITGGATEGTSLARNLIIGFSIAGFVAISYMLVRRLSELRRHARIAFLYLQTQHAYHTARQEISMEGETFEKGLQQVEQYLNNSDWNMASISLNYLRGDYQGMFDKGAEVEIERKRLDDKKVTYQDLGIY